jgi:hypothetical protein
MHKSIYLGYDITSHQFQYNFQEVDNSEKSTIVSSLKGQAPYAIRQLHKFQALKKTTVAVIHFVREVILNVSTAAVRRLVK